MQENTPAQTVEQVETVPEGAQAMKLVQGPDGEFYLVPQDSAPIAATPEPAIEDSSGLFRWADPILEDPIGWAQTYVLNSEIMGPYLLQVGV
ncbi:MAG: hypothetical protein AAFR82_10760, partial [Pseudomonadota bacterium]